MIFYKDQQFCLVLEMKVPGRDTADKTAQQWYCIVKILRLGFLEEGYLYFSYSDEKEPRLVWLYEKASFPGGDWHYQKADHA